MASVSHRELQYTGVRERMPGEHVKVHWMVLSNYDRRCRFPDTASGCKGTFVYKEKYIYTLLTDKTSAGQVSMYRFDSQVTYCLHYVASV